MSTRGNQSNRGDGRGGRGSSRGRGLDRGGGQRGDGRGRGRGGSRGRGQDSGRGSPGASSPQRGSRGSYRARGDRGSYVARGTAGAHSAHIPVAHGAHVPSTSGQPPVATIGPRAPDEEAYQDLINRLRPLSLSDGPKHPPRPGIGKAGTKTLVQANFFPIKLPVGPFYEYTVTMEPNPKRGWERKQIFKLFMESQEMEAFRPHIAHDNSQRLISAKLLPENLEPVFIPFHEDGEEPNVDSTTHTVQLTLKETLDLDKLKQYIAGNPEARDPDAIQPLIGALDLVAQQHAGQEGYRVGKNKYFIPSKAERFELSPGIDAFQGFYLSVRPAYKDLMLNVNVATAAFFRPGNLADALLTFGLRTGGANLTLPEGFSEKIKMTVKTLHNGFRRKIKQIGTTSARRTTFPKGGRTVTVEQYFKEEYPDIRLNHPDDRPVIDVSGPSSPNPVWIPSELCEILPGQPLFDLTEQHLRLMIKNISQKSPSANRTAILNNGFPSLGLVPRRPPLDGDGFGIEVGGEMITVEARQLRPPNVTYSPQKLARITDASWNFMNEKFHKGVVVRSWWVVVIKDGGRASTGTQDPKIQNLVRDFVKKCRDSGMSIPLAQGQGRGQGQGQGRGRGEPRYMDIQLPRHEKWKKDRREAVEKIRNVFEGEVDTNGKPEFALVLLENQDSFIYPAIKRIGDVELGLTTVHILLDKLFRNNRPDQYYANVALKVNTKLGGINHKLDPPAMAWLKKKPTMMVGIDVTHPGIKAKWGSPSIAAVVANLDDEFVQFPGSIGIQKGREEMVQNLKGMMIERLDLYKKKNKRLPERVFVFRDGVSEGQFKIVNRDELPQILEAFSAFSTAGQGGAYRPKLSIVVCGKRHHARAYPINPNDQQQATRNGNTKPGTVIDTGITAVFDFDFYLQAHAGIQGHAKPTHYTIIYDENTFSADEIQQGTHNASYLYARASKAVSLVPPAYYADLACERGRCYLNDFLSFEDPEKNKGIGKGKGKDKDKDKKREEERKRVYELAKKAWGEGLHDDMKDTMFYI